MTSSLAAPVCLQESSDDAAGFAEAVERVHKMIDDTVKAGTPANKIVVGGFSQGGRTLLLLS